MMPGTADSCKKPFLFNFRKGFHTLKLVINVLIHLDKYKMHKKIVINIWMDLFVRLLPVNTYLFAGPLVSWQLGADALVKKLHPKLFRGLSYKN